MLLFTFIVGIALIVWLFKLNKDYYVLSFFAKRVRTVDGTPLESKVPVAKGRTIFGNAFDLLGLDSTGVFELMNRRAKEIGTSYVSYVIGRPILNVIDAETAEMMLNDTSLLAKGFVYKFIEPVLHKGILTSTGQKWHSRRKMLTPTFHFNILTQFHEVFKAETMKFIEFIIKQNSSEVSLTTWIPRFTLNTICETAMGVNLDDMAEQGDRYRESFNMIEDYFIKRIGNPLFWNDTIFKLIAGNKFQQHLDVVHNFSNDIIAKRRRLFAEESMLRKATQTDDDDIYIVKKQRFAMLDTLINAEEDGLIDNAGVIEEVNTLMVGGFETTSISLTYAIMNLSLYPDMQERCYQEVLEHTDADISLQDGNQLNKLKYLECFIKETIRLYPVVSTISRKITQETQLANGLILPADSQIVLHIYSIHHNPIYYPNPQTFDPARFEPENSANRHPYAFIPFSAGQRNCIGQRYAMLEMKTLLVAIIRKFKILPITDPKTLIFEAGLVVRPKNDVRVQFVPRN